MMKTFTSITLALALSGCAGIDTYKQTALGQAQSATDRLTLDALWWLCEGSSIGSFQRQPGMVKDRIVALCQERQPTWTSP